MYWQEEKDYVLEVLNVVQENTVKIFFIYLVIKFIAII